MSTVEVDEAKVETEEKDPMADSREGRVGGLEAVKGRSRTTGEVGMGRWSEERRRGTRMKVERDNERDADADPDLR